MLKIMVSLFSIGFSIVFLDLSYCYLKWRVAFYFSVNGVVFGTFADFNVGLI